MTSIAPRVWTGIAILGLLSACAHTRPEFWAGRIDDTATSSYFEYQKIKQQMDGISYRKLAKLLRPGRFSGPTADGSGYLFTWPSPDHFGGALMVECDKDGKVVSHFFVTP